eukprot:jgi/Botrbrau1/2096/Bobra.0093s0004.1
MHAPQTSTAATRPLVLGIGKHMTPVCFPSRKHCKGTGRRQSWRPRAEPDAVPPAYRWAQEYPGLGPKNAASSNAGDEEPWNICFQCNERYLSWDDSATRQLMKTWVQRRLGETTQGMDVRMSTLGAILPDLVGKMERMKADTLLAFLQDLNGVTIKVIRLREMFRTINVSQLVAKMPALVLNYDPCFLSTKFDSLRRFVGSDEEAERLIQIEPMLLLADMEAVLNDVERLIPAGVDGRREAAMRYLLANPRLVLDMNSAGLPSAIDGDLTQQLRSDLDE